MTAGASSTTNSPTRTLGQRRARRREQLEDNLGALELEFAAAELDRLEEVSRIELGFPHDFGADRLAHGTTRPLIDSHRAYRPGPRKEKA